MERQDIIATTERSNIGSNKRIKLVTIHLYLLLCKNLLVATNGFFKANRGIINSGIIAIVAISYLWVFVLSERKLKVPKSTFLAVLLLLVYFAISAVFKPDLFSNTGVREQLTFFMGYCFPFFFAISTIEDTDGLFESLIKYAYIPLFFSILGFAFSLRSQTSNLSYNMSFGYSILFVNCIYLSKYKLYHRPIDLIVFIVTAFFILVSGSRGPVVFIIASVIVAFLTSGFSIRKLLVSIVILGLATVFLLNFSTIIEWVSSTLAQFGIYSRTLNMLRVQSITFDSGRSEIHEKLISQINQSPIIGLGAFGAAYYVYLAHSLYLDTFACFGYVGGSIILLTIFYKDYCAIKHNWNTLTAEFLIMLTVLSFAGGFFSDSFFEKKELWMLLGVLIAQKTTESRTVGRSEVLH